MSRAACRLSASTAGGSRTTNQSGAGMLMGGSSAQKWVFAVVQLGLALGATYWLVDPER